MGASMPVGHNSIDQKRTCLVDSADQTCPYSKAIRGNIDVAISLV